MLKRDSSGIIEEDCKRVEKKIEAWVLISSSSSTELPPTEILSMRFLEPLNLGKR